jgi:acyl carrier protein
MRKVYYETRRKSVTQDTVEISSIEQSLVAIIAQASFTRVPADAIKLEDALGDLGIDSLAFMEVVVSVEEQFNFTVDDKDLAVERFETVASLRDYILSKTSVVG